MQRCLSFVLAVFLPVLSTQFFGCTRAPKRIHPPGINASSAGSGAMSEYDTDGDGAVSGDELEKAGSLRSAMAQIDADQDGRITADEVTRRVEEWQETRVGIMTADCTVTLNGAPLADATVTLEPEPFLGESVKPASGKSSERGSAYLSIAEEFRQDPRITGAHCGLFKVRISKKVGGQETVPPQFNSETTLGCEVAQDAAWINEGLRFDLTTTKKSR